MIQAVFLIALGVSCSAYRSAKSGVAVEKSGVVIESESNVSALDQGTVGTVIKQLSDYNTVLQNEVRSLKEQLEVAKEEAEGCSDLDEEDSDEEAEASGNFDCKVTCNNKLTQCWGNQKAKDGLNTKKKIQDASGKKKKKKAVKALCAQACAADETTWANACPALHESYCVYQNTINGGKVYVKALDEGFCV